MRVPEQILARGLIVRVVRAAERNHPAPFWNGLCQPFGKAEARANWSGQGVVEEVKSVRNPATSSVVTVPSPS